MKNVFKVSTTVAAITLLAACGSTPADLNENVPEWVLNPTIEDGLAAATCIPFSGDISTDNLQLQATTRTSLARQVGIQVDILDKTYNERINVDNKAAVGSTFSAVSSQATSEMLVGTRPLKTAFADIDNTRQYCMLMGFGSESTKELFDNIVKRTGKNLSIDNERVLYQEFKAQKAHEELKALKKNR